MPLKLCYREPQGLFLSRIRLKQLEPCFLTKKRFDFFNFKNTVLFLCIRTGLVDVIVANLVETDLAVFSPVLHIDIHYTDIQTGIFLYNTLF